MTERAGVEYLEGRVRELEADNERLVGETDRLVRRIDQLVRRMDAMARASQMYAAVRTSIRRPRALLGLPVELARVARRPVRRPDEGSVSGPPPALAIAADHRYRVAMDTRTRLLEGGRVRDLRRLRVGIVADDPLLAALQPECDLRVVGADRPEAVFDDPPDLLLVQSAWRGSGGWRHRVAWYPHPDAMRLSHLRDLVERCRASGVPTIFWDTEGRTRYERFAPAAQLFDQIFSVDQRSVERFAESPERSAAGVGHLPLAVQPRLHNPTGRPASAGPPVFIGSYDRSLPLAEREQLDLLLEAGADAGLVIFDRHAGADPEWFAFPERLRGNVAGWLPTGSVPATIRAHRVTLVEPSAHLVPARVFEALACGRPVVTTSAAAAASMFDGAVLHGATAAELGEILAGRRPASPGGDTTDVTVARIMRSETYGRRLATMARSVGFDVAPRSEGVALLALVDDESLADRLVAVIDGSQDDLVEVVVGSSDADAIGRTIQAGVARLPSAPVLRMVHQAADGSGPRIRRLAATAAADFVHVADLRRDAGRSSLDPLLGALAYADADVVGAPLDAGSAYAPTETIDTGAALVRRTELLERGWFDDPGSGRDGLKRWAADGVRIYAAGSPQDGPRR
jgi:hypothetical protein